MRVGSLALVHGRHRVAVEPAHARLQVQLVVPAHLDRPHHQARHLQAEHLAPDDAALDDHLQALLAEVLHEGIRDRAVQHAGNGRGHRGHRSRTLDGADLDRMVEEARHAGQRAGQVVHEQHDPPGVLAQAPRDGPGQRRG